MDQHCCLLVKGENTYWQRAPWGKTHWGREWKKTVSHNHVDLCLLWLFFLCIDLGHHSSYLYVAWWDALHCRLLMLRKAEKEEEKIAREKIRQRLEEDKVFLYLEDISSIFTICASGLILMSLMSLIWSFGSGTFCLV